MALCEQNMATLGRCFAQNGLYLLYLNASWCSRGPTLQMLRGKNCTTNTSVNNEEGLGATFGTFRRVIMTSTMRRMVMRTPPTEYSIVVIRLLSVISDWRGPLLYNQLRQA